VLKLQVNVKNIDTKTLNGGINQPAFRHYRLLQGVFWWQCKHPEEDSNAETSVDLYLYKASFQDCIFNIHFTENHVRFWLKMP